VVGVDVVVQPDSVIPIEHYDGLKLPFPDRSFDSVVLIDVLHHADDPPALLAEAARVAKDHVLIKDHFFRNWLDWHILKWADYGGNAPHGIRLPCNYLNLAAWQAAFDSAELEVLTQKPFTRYSYDPCQHIVFHLGKADRALPS
jgi:SAM-dependent methyltransferase